MIPYPDIDPVIISLGPLQLHWYGLMYVLGISGGWFLVKYQIKKFKLSKVAVHFENLNFVLILCLILGARLGYVFLYNFDYFLRHPLEIVAIWHGGMSFHGGFFFMLCGGYIYCRLKKLDFLQTADLYAVVAPIGIGLVRLANFINGELFGRITDVPWAMVFPAGGPLPRHPSQLYQFLLEGLLLFIILWILKNKHWQQQWPAGSMLAFFLICYGVFRVIVEFFREPDIQIGFIVAWLTMGQLLSGLMIIAGVIFFILKGGLKIKTGADTS